MRKEYLKIHTLKREPATKIRFNSTGRVERLTYIGEGASCLVYETERRDIIKEFCPVINGRPTMSRKGGPDDRFTYIESLTPFDRAIVEERRVAFDSEIGLIEELNSRYRNDEDNMFLIPQDIPDTSLGRCHWCAYVGGRTLESVFDELKRSQPDIKDRLMSVLPFIISLYNEIAFYHADNVDGGAVGILNLDVKPENLFAIRSQGDYIGIRNLDFGSIRRIYDRYDGGSVSEYGLISSIRRFAKENESVEKGLLVDQIAEKFFACSPGFYDSDRITKTVVRCIDTSTPIEDVASDLRLLDILAAWKTLLYALSDPEEWFYDGDKLRIETEAEMVDRIFARTFENANLSAGGSLFESYIIYCELYEIMARSFKGKRIFRLTASEIAERLRNILCILKGVAENKKTEQQRDIEVMDRIFITKDGLLASHGLRTVGDIVKFCSVNELKKCERPGALCWFLTFGEKHV